MRVTPEQLQFVGVAILVLLGVGLLFWLTRAIMGWHNGNPVYMLPDSDEDDEQAGDDPPQH